jgi:hypothetical protein
VNNSISPPQIVFFPQKFKCVKSLEGLVGVRKVGFYKQIIFKFEVLLS